MKKQVKGFILGIIFMMIISNSTFASGFKGTIEVVFNSINLQINGQKVDADNILYKGTTYIPLRKAAEILGKEVVWNQTTNTANIIDIKKDMTKEETINYDNGDKYVGQTKNGQRHGKGTYYYKSGEKYTGDWFEDFETGKGIHYLANGKKGYEINFLYGTQTGKITYYFEDGGRYEGEISNGNLSSKGIMYFSDGSNYEGEYKDGKEHGRGKYTFSNGDYLEGDFVEGKFMTGKSKVTLNGTEIITDFINGVPITPYDATGSITPDTVIESSIDGEFTGWDGDTIFKLQNGQIWQQSSFSYKYTYKYSPKVLIYKSGLGYKMKVDGVDGEISVKRLK